MRRISRRKERKKKILDLLEKEKATFKTILAVVKCGRATLSNDLKLFVKYGIIRKYEDPDDLRIKWYENVIEGPDDRVKAEKGKYASIDFIETLETPVYENASHGKTTISVFISGVKEQDRNSTQIMANRVANIYNKTLRLIGGKLIPGQKIAVVVTIES